MSIFNKGSYYTLLHCHFGRHVRMKYDDTVNGQTGDTGFCIDCGKVRLKYGEPPVALDDLTGLLKTINKPGNVVLPVRVSVMGALLEDYLIANIRNAKIDHDYNNNVHVVSDSKLNKVYIFTLDTQQRYRITQIIRNDRIHNFGKRVAVTRDGNIISVMGGGYIKVYIRKDVGEWRAVD